MASLLSDLKSYLTEQGSENIFINTLPAQPEECIGLFLRENLPSASYGGSATRRVEVQVRRTQDEAAYLAAAALCEVLDSGEAEEKIQLTASRWNVIRLLSLPIPLQEETDGQAVYTFEIALWGENIP